ncbi:TrkA C-terminal domain-containing protein [Domibacillus sp. DTU_2020_1001157_1_SI_ALB_TIR_016]|uniref:TrkA C-terminal domain-containing protein n=1 Tax=Domibacillus sp. DTU_2020_1001157_1_SI_ALB_TIR_016 TaxID=3077789 RepID=UPI0028EDC77F|nr:TrkA C-terminal domain-containing protein [Domibacillus sp. DTU_2020_1001157_1_SI_ALB_TIR_016]WNS80115.1 TrkA C-terminal domain-containing protein [Domibacillus sp. DTU_2020_1001157_1_SI_ALB_TIR_016]
MGFVFILLYLVIVVLVIEISVIAFHLTGLEKEVARYQAISMLTGTGFTTDESQLIIDHPVRRRISMFLILFGAFSLAVIISAITNILANDLRLKELMIISSVLLAIYILGKTPVTKKLLQHRFKHEMKKNLDISELPVKEALFLQEDDIVTDVVVEEGTKLDGKKVEDVFEHGHDANLLFIKRGEVNVRENLTEETIQAGDKLYLYGNKKVIEKLTKETESDDPH